MSKPLIVFAHEDEAQAFQAVPHLVTGIGKINAVSQLSQRLSRGDVSEVIVLGTAGMIDDSLNLDTVYRVRAAIQHDFEFPTETAVLNADGTVVMVGSEVAQKSAAAGESAVPEALIATGDVFVKDDALRAQLTAEGAHLVDMESYAYAVLCHVFETPIRIFKVPSDFADSATEHETWDDIVARKSEELFKFAQEHALL